MVEEAVVRDVNEELAGAECGSEVLAMATYAVVLQAVSASF